MNARGPDPQPETVPLYRISPTGEKIAIGEVEITEGGYFVANIEDPKIVERLTKADSSCRIHGTLLEWDGYAVVCPKCLFPENYEEDESNIVRGED